MKTQVVTVTNRVPDRGREPYYHFNTFLQSLERFGAVPEVLGMGEPWWGLMTKPRRLRHWLRGNGCTADALIVSDSYDVVFTASPDEIGERWGGGDEVMFNAEKGLFPRGDLLSAFPECGTPWRYLNSGLFIGKPKSILAMLEAMSLDDLHDDHKSDDILHGGGGVMVNTNDQGWYQFTFAAHPVPMVLDTKCEVFQCLSACEASEFNITGERFRNIATGTEPLAWHFNGGAKDLLMPLFLPKWGLSE